MILRYILSLLFLAASLPGLLAAEEEYWEYTFRPGDSIWKIAEKYTTSVNNWVEIQELNKIRQGPDRRIPPGTRCGSYGDGCGAGSSSVPAGTRATLTGFDATASPRTTTNSASA